MNGAAVAWIGTSGDTVMVMTGNNEILRDERA